MKNSKDLTKRTLYYFWMATKKKPGFFLLDILTTFGYVALLTYVNNYLMGRVVDRIIVVSDGKVAEDGSHEELLAADGEYAKLWDRQTGAFLQ